MLGVLSDLFLRGNHSAWLPLEQNRIGVVLKVYEDNVSTQGNNSNVSAAFTVCQALWSTLDVLRYLILM